MVSTCDNFDKLAKKLGTTDKGFIDFCTSLKNGDITLKEGQTYLQAYQEQLNSLGFSFSKVKSMAKDFIGNLGANVLNALGGMAVSALAGGLMTLAGKGIEWVYKKISGKAEAEALEKMSEKAQDAQSKIKSLQSEIKQNADTVDEAGKKYAEFAQGVNQLTGKNISLSDDEYKEFLDVSNQLAEVFPQLTKGYDDNGNAILDLQGNVDGITGKLKDLLEIEQQLAQQEINKKESLCKILLSFRII